MPVRKNKKGAYLLSFEKPFRFVPDSLADIVTRIIRKPGTFRKLHPEHV
jgi:hypothetical protein